jgi:hypothetical protein
VLDSGEKIWNEVELGVIAEKSRVVPCRREKMWFEKWSWE